LGTILLREFKDGVEASLFQAAIGLKEDFIGLNLAKHGAGSLTSCIEFIHRRSNLKEPQKVSEVACLNHFLSRQVKKAVALRVAKPPELF
jgi:hypothetical protein